MALRDRPGGAPVLLARTTATGARIGAVCRQGSGAFRGRVVRREARRRVAYPGLKAVDEFLTSNMAGKLQVILSTIEPGGGTGAEPYTHDSDEEVVVILAGVLDLWVGDEHYVLREGDAITFPSRLPHWNMNHGEQPVVVLFCVTPPSF